MSDDERELCGAETTDGTPCQNYAETCPWDHGGENNTGRPFTIDEDDHEDILDAARMGKSESGCARAAGTDWTQLSRYLQSHDEFRGAFARARAQGEAMLVRDGLSDPNVDTSMAKFLLASSFDYVKEEKQQHEHSGEIDGFDFTINANDDS